MTETNAGKCILSGNVEIEGSITFEKELLIDGKVQGQITSDGVLTIGENADVRGEIKAKSISIFVPIAGVSVDKLLALRGDPNLRIAFDQPHQHIHAHINECTWDELLAKLPRRNSQVEPPRITADPPENAGCAGPSGEATSASVADTPRTAT